MGAADARRAVGPRSVAMPKGEGVVSRSTRTIAWDLVAVEYRTGLKTARQIGAEFGISHTAVNNRAKADGWTRDLAAKIKAKADDKLSRAVLSRQLSTASAETECEVVDAYADTQFRVRMKHRQDIRRSRSLWASMIEELEAASDDVGRSLIERMAEIVSGPAKGESKDESERRADRMRRQLAKLLEHGARVDSFKKLVETQEKLTKLECEAYGIDNNKGSDGGIEALLEKLGRS